MNFEATLDGSGKAPRPIQIDYFRHLMRTMRDYRVHGMAGPPGIGKSFIARTIQRTLPNTVIITNNNLLVDQYTYTYRELNGVKGKDYYDEIGEYRLAQQRATFQPSVFNPLSFYYFHLRNPSLPKPSTVIIDEAHSLVGCLCHTRRRAPTNRFLVFLSPPTLSSRVSVISLVS